MDDAVRITTDIDSSVAAELDDLAARSGVPREELVATAIDRFLQEESGIPAHERLGFATPAEMDEFIQVGQDDLDNGRVVPHEEVMTMLDSWIAEFDSQCRK